MDEPPNQRPCDQPQPEPQYQHPTGQHQQPTGQQYPQPGGQYQQQPGGQYQQQPGGQHQQQPGGQYQQQPGGQYQPPPTPYQQAPGQYQKPPDTSPPTPPGHKCEEPQPPPDPCSDPNAPTVPEPCLVQPFQERIKQLEDQSNKEDKDSSKGELAAYQKLSDEVWKAEKQYAGDFETLLFQEANAKAFYDKIRSDLLNGRISAAERKRIAEIVYCRPDVEHLRTAWIDARNMIPDLQRDFTKAQMAFSDQDEIYKAALTKYQDAQKALDALQAQVSKEFNARNYRNAWYLNEFEMCPTLCPPPLPCEFNPWLEAIAKEHVVRSEALRKAKVALDQKTAESQRKKKEFEDAKAKRRDDILKAIGADPFPPDTKPSQPTSPNQPGYQTHAV